MRAVPPTMRPCGAAVVTVTTPSAHAIAVMPMAAPLEPVTDASVWRLSVMSLFISIASMNLRATPLIVRFTTNQNWSLLPYGIEQIDSTVPSVTLRAQPMTS
jgi:hypothetical protein